MRFISLSNPNYLRRSISTVLCAISGGVDSAVSAYLLKEKGVYMTNWDLLDENSTCSSSSDRLDAQPVINLYEHGATPNPDILCNRFVKFNLLCKELLKKSDSNSFSSNFNADAIATGHYCRNSFGESLIGSINEDEPKLLRPTDLIKDQTFWLSTISHQDLRHCIFPMGNLLKPQVKKIANDIGLSRIATRRESMGMCFIGKRRFRDFINEYIKPTSGSFKDLETGLVLGEHNGIHHFTLGQRVAIENTNGPFYVANSDYNSQTVFVVNYPTHPSLFMRLCWTGPAVWINSKPPEQLESGSNIHFQWQNKWKPVNSKISGHESVALARNSLSEHIKNERYVGNSLNLPVDTNVASGLVEVGKHRCVGPCLSIRLENIMRCIAPGQWAALYDGNVCLGAAMIHGSISLWDEGHLEPYTKWNHADYELNYEHFSNSITADDNKQ